MHSWALPCAMLPQVDVCLSQHQAHSFKLTENMAPDSNKKAPTSK